MQGLPMHCKTIFFQTKIGGNFGKVKDATIFEFPNTNTAIKLNIIIDISKPILAEMYIGIPRDGTFLVEFKYERFLMFYLL